MAIKRTLILATFVFLPMASAFAQEAPTEQEKVLETRTALEQYVQTRRILSKTSSHWVEGKTLLESRIAMLERDIATIEKRITEAEENIAETDTKVQELSDERDSLKLSSSALTEVIGNLEGRTLKLLASLPQPLIERVRPLSQGIPGPNKDPENIGLARRFQNIIGVMDMVNKFHRAVTPTSEIRTMPDGTKAEVTVLYIGIGLAYYSNADGTQAGIGTPGPEGWVWEAADASAPAIALAVAIHNNEAPAAFVQLPVHID